MPKTTWPNTTTISQVCTMKMCRAWLILALLAAVPMIAPGCATKYMTPGRAADFGGFVGNSIERAFQIEPAATYPANMVMVRVQEPGYRSHTTKSYGQGRFSIVTVRDVETDGDYARIEDLPDIAQVGTINRLMLERHLDSDEPLRKAAAMLHADLLLIYSFDTEFFVDDKMKPLTVISLGLSPNKQVQMTSTASAVLLDVRTGFVHGACEASAQRKQLANAWTSEDAADQSRLKTEREAFEKLLDQFEGMWRERVAARHGGTASMAAER